MASPYDAVVVGAGPAGSAIATRLVGRGKRVLLLDRAEFPRRKACGECLNPGAVMALERLGVLRDVLAAGALEIQGWRLHPENGPAFQGALPSGTRGLAIPRDRLDTILLEHARRSGAEVRLGARVSDLVRRGTAVAGVVSNGERVRARLVVGADGLRSVVLRRLGLLRRQPWLRKVALAAHVRGVRPAGRWGRMYLEDHGCIGVVEASRGGTNVVVVVDSTHFRQVSGSADAYFDAALRRVPELCAAERIDSVMATGPFDWPVRSAVADGALLVGDAAGYFDPFTGQGIFRALRGAEIAAEVAGDALDGGHCSAARLHAYERSRRREFGPGERLQRGIEFVLARRTLISLAATVLSSRPWLCDKLVAATADARPQD